MVAIPALNKYTDRHINITISTIINILFNLHVGHSTTLNIDRTPIVRDIKPSDSSRYSIYASMST